MNPNPKMAAFKYAFTGTNCSGKTTMALAVTARLKRQAILAEIVCSQDRKISWKDDYFPFTPIAHYGMITNLIHAEVAASLKGDADVIITDRSVLDLYAIMATDHPDHSMTLALEPTILEWLETYTRIYYLAPLAYQEDGKRPADDFRMRTHAMLRRFMDKYSLPNVEEVDRTEVYKQIAQDMGFHVPNPIFAQEAKWQAIVNAMGVEVVVKEQTCETTSDIDVWILLPIDKVLAGDYSPEGFLSVVEAYFGCDHTFNLLVTAPESFKDFEAMPSACRHYTPQ